MANSNLSRRRVNGRRVAVLNKRLCVLVGLLGRYSVGRIEMLPLEYVSSCRVYKRNGVIVLLHWLLISELLIPCSLLRVLTFSVVFNSLQIPYRTDSTYPTSLRLSKILYPSFQTTLVCLCILKQCIRRRSVLGANVPDHIQSNRRTTVLIRTISVLIHSE